MDLTATKAVALVVLGLIKLVSGLAPLVVTKLLKKKSDRFLKKFIGKFWKNLKRVELLVPTIWQREAFIVCFVTFKRLSEPILGRYIHQN